MPVDERLPPAAAYYEVAELLGDVYFNTQPPRVGRCLEVRSPSDNRPTWWEVTVDQAQRLVDELARRPRAAVITDIVSFDRAPERP